MTRAVEQLLDSFEALSDAESGRDTRALEDLAARIQDVEVPLAISQVETYRDLRNVEIPPRRLHMHGRPPVAEGSQSPDHATWGERIHKIMTPLRREVGLLIQSDPWR